jgi:actin-related protein
MKIFESLGLNMEDIAHPLKMQRIEDLICVSIMHHKDAETRNKAANNIILTGGLAETPHFLETLEDKLIERIGKYDPNIDRVEIHNFGSRKIDTKTISWLGGTVIPKLDCMEDGFISRER